MTPVSVLPDLLRALQPERQPGTYVFAALEPDSSVGLNDIVALVREAEGVSVVVAEGRAEALGLAPVLRCAWITLRVHSDLLAVGLTAAVSAALADAQVACNMVAGVRHDHLFVPVAQAEAAMDVLRRLQATACAQAGR